MVAVAVVTIIAVTVAAVAAILRDGGTGADSVAQTFHARPSRHPSSQNRDRGLRPTMDEAEDIFGATVLAASAVPEVEESGRLMGDF